MGIKLEEGDVCLGGALIGNRNDTLVVETAGGKTMEFRRQPYEQTVARRQGLRGGEADELRARGAAADRAGGLGPGGGQEGERQRAQGQRQRRAADVV